MHLGSAMRYGRGVFWMIKKGDTIPGIFTSVIGSLALYFVLSNKKMVIVSTKRGVSLGAGFFPFVCGIALLLLGVLLIIKGIRQQGKVDYFQMTETKKENIKIVILLAILCVILLAGWKFSKLFFVCLPIYAVLVNIVLKRNWLFSILFTLLMTAFIYLLFHIGFHVTFRP